MNENELDREFRALEIEQAELDAEHRRLELHPADTTAHRMHIARLRDHIARLHRYMESRGMKVHLKR